LWERRRAVNLVGVSEHHIRGYPLDEVLARSSRGESWRARDGQGRQVLVKLVRATDAEVVMTFTSRALSASRLRQASVAVLTDRGRSGDFLFAVREYFDGASLATRAAALDVAGVLKLALKIGRGLEHAHLHGLVHGAIKPENVIVSGDGTPTLVDFTLVPVAASGEFAAPEQGFGALVDARVDQFGLAALTRWLLARESGASAPTDSRLNQALERGLAEQPERRFRQLGELVSELESALERRAKSGAQDESSVGIQAIDRTLRVTVTGSWTPRAVDACTRDLDLAIQERNALAIGYVLAATGGCHSTAIDMLTELHRRHRGRLKRVGFVSDSPQARGASVLIGTRVAGLDWRTFSSLETMETWLREVGP
jgi:serine/threonine protein kinase